MKRTLTQQNEWARTLGKEIPLETWLCIWNTVYVLRENLTMSLQWHLMPHRFLVFLKNVCTDFRVSDHGWKCDIVFAYILELTFGR